MPSEHPDHSTTDIVKPNRLGQLRSILHSALIMERDYGHARSLVRQASVDRDGNPIPWYTYAAVAWLQNLDLADLDVFEFGSGNSTLFWATHAKTVRSVEDDRDWYVRVSRTLPPNARCVLLPEPDEYVNSCSDTYDIVVVDGSHRLACARASVARVREGGAMILDNADWFPNVTSLLREAGLTQVDFIGMAPINPYASATSVFLRDGGTRLRHKGAFEVRSGIVQQGTDDI